MPKVVPLGTSNVSADQGRLCRAAVFERYIRELDMPFNGRAHTVAGTTFLRRLIDKLPDNGNRDDGPRRIG